MSGPSSLRTRVEPQLTANGLEVFRARYLRKNDRGQIIETPTPTCRTGLIERCSFAVREDRIREGRCLAGETRIDGVEMDNVKRWPSAA